MSNRAAKTAKRKAKLKARAQHQARVGLFDFICEHCGYANFKPGGKETSCNCCFRCAWSKHVKMAACGDHKAPSGRYCYSPYPCDGMMRPFVVRDYELIPGGPKKDAWYWICEGCGLSTQKLDCGDYVPGNQDGEEFIYDAEQFPAGEAA